MKATPAYARFAYVLVWLALWLPWAAEGQTPELKGRVNDLAGVISSQDALRLTDLLATYERQTTNQIAVLTIPSLGGESIEAYALRVSNAWGLGRKGVDNGILIVLAMQERTVRIALGRGFERYISNERAAEIIRNDMTPAFKRGDYASGLESGIRQLMGSDPIKVKH